jgi:mannosylglycoprotein endo-beta-mannosidase
MRELEKQGTIIIDKPQLQSPIYNSIKYRVNDVDEFTEATFVIETNSAILADKLKTLRHELNKWYVSLAKLKQLIKNCNNVILTMDSLEEQRPLYTVEFNFRNVVKIHLDGLLLAECNYWRKRCTIRWIKQGEDNTKNFHDMATERYRRNAIVMLRDVDGNEVTDHQGMAGLLWREYKDRMGRSEPISMQFDLPRILHAVDGLHELTRPYEEKEMDEVIKNMLGDRAHGPDRFNGLFLKKCWPIIKQDFYKLAADFHDETIQLKNINGSFITLVPKKQAPVQVNHFRPISLTSMCIKFLTKLAANRLQDKILPCIHKNQYGFLRSRSIQDCLAWSFEYLFLCHASKKPIILLNLDFTKAFDTIEHEAIPQVMQHKGFNAKWINWARII